MTMQLPLDSIAAVKAALVDLENGDSGLPARQALQDLCKELGVVIWECAAEM